MGTLALYDASAENYPLLRLLGNVVARGERFCPDALAVSPDGRRVVFIGPTEYTVTVVDAKSLDEVRLHFFVRQNIVFGCIIYFRHSSTV